MRKRALLFNVAVTLLCVSLLVICFSPTSAETITSFDGSVSSKTINFYTRGDSTELAMTIPDDVPVTSVYVNVSTADLGTGEFCEQPGIDFGPDNDYEWQFKGKGYGAFGKQYMFNTNNSRATHTFSSAGSQSGTKIRMPKDAEVSSASMGVNGRLQANTPTERLIGSYNYLHGPAVGKLNNDAYPDMVTPYFYYSNGMLFWWKSSGGANPSYQRYTVDSGLTYPDDADIGDLNGDGINDIALAAARYYTGYPSLIWYKNGGGATPSFAKSIVDSSLGGTDVKIAKIDGDSDNDMVFGTYYNGLYWYSNNGGLNPTFTRKTIDNSLSYIEQIDVGDVDGDGDLDVGVTCYSSGGGVYVYLNSNNGNTWTQVKVGSGMTYGWDFMFADIDQDGDLDCAATSYYDRTIKWYENVDKTPDKGSGDGKSWNEYVITSSFMYAHGLYITDIANDGYIDIFCTGYYGNYFYWFEAPDDPRTGTWTKFTVDTYLYYGWDCVVTDITGDGKPDVIATSYISGGLTWYDLSYSYPTNPSIQFGGTGSTDWSYSGTCNGQFQTNDVTTKIQSLVDAGSPMTDSYGNQYVEFPIKVSLGSGGRLTLENLDIRYNLTVTVDKNPHNNDLKTEINELVPDYGDGETTLYMNVHSNSAGSLTISGLNLEYNGFPKQKKNIPDFHVAEDSVNENLFDVRQYFEDDYESADELHYIVHMTTDDMMKVRVSLVNNYYIKADCSLYPNWNGEVSVSISAKDRGELGQGSTGQRITYSNTFTIIVDPVNDPPTMGSEYLQNQQMNEGETKILPGTMDDKKYFQDIEDDTLYYKGAIDPDDKYNGEEMKIIINGDNQIVLTAQNDFHGMKIPVRIYCTDQEDDWSNINDCPYQDFTVTVKQLMDDRPKWGYIEDLIMIEDTDLPEAVQLRDYVSSIDVPVTALTLSIVYNVNGSSIFADIDSEGFLNLYASAKNFDGMTDIVIRASDSYNYADTSVRVIVEPVNDAPSGRIIEPTDKAQVQLGERVRITGAATDPESIEEVVIRIGSDGNWVKASGAGSWQYNWEVDTEKYNVGDKVQISMRVYDGEVFSPVYSVNVSVIPGTGPGSTDDRDGDGVKDAVDKFPDDPSEWADTDRDKRGDNQADAFPDDPGEWEDSDLDGIGDNSDPTPYGEDLISDTNTGTVEKEAAGSSFFTLWWLVLLLVAVEALFIVLLGIKKFRSKKPIPKKKQKVAAEKTAYGDDAPKTDD